MAITMRHAAIVEIGVKQLLEMIDFRGGIIHKVYMEDQFLHPDYIRVVLEHPDLEPVPENQMLPTITPVMQIHYAKDGGIIKVERIEPAKKVIVQERIY